MRKVDGPNGPIWIRETTVKVMPSGTSRSYYSQLLGRKLDYREIVEVDVSDLPPKSNVEIAIMCPMCGKEWHTTMYSITTKGHSYCQPCAQRISAYGDLIGRKVGRLTITGFAEPWPSKSGGNLTTVTAICDCGNTITTLAQGIKDAIRNSQVSSCGCYNRERIREQGRNNAGPNNGMYRHDLTLPQRVARRKLLKRVKGTWGKAIRRRDAVCVICGSPNNLESHHLYNTVSHPELCLSPENGVTICTTHHQDFHCNYMGHVHTPTTPGDFYAYLKDVHGWSDGQVQSLISSKKLC